MNNYITLDGKKYMTHAKSWKPILGVQATVRNTWDGVVDVTYGSNSIVSFEGGIFAPVTPPDTSWGTHDDLETSLKKRAEIQMTDHLGTVRYVFPYGEFPRETMTNMWDAPTNRFLYFVKLIQSRTA